jgi:Rrf2 family protein
MFLTRETDYAIRCILCLAREPGRVISAGEISESMVIPKSFLVKILQRLSKKGLVKSTQGIAGGFQLTRAPGKVNLFEVIEAIQGSCAVNLCVADEQNCNLSATCLIHAVWVELKKNVERNLKKRTFAGLLASGKKDIQVERGGSV